MKTIHYFTNIAPHYRKLLWKNILENAQYDFHFFFGKNPTQGIQEIDFKNNEFNHYQNKLHRITNLFFKGKVIIWQKGVIRNCFTEKPYIAVFLGDMYIISIWLAALICRIRGVEVVFWGHGIYGNEGKLKLFVRKTFCKLANKHLLYERRAKQLMINLGFKPYNLYVVFNSLNYVEHLKLRKHFQTLSKPEVFPFFENPSLPVLVFIGRLTSVKKLNLLVETVNEINQSKPNVNLVLIGEGPERKKLEELGNKGLIDKWMHFIGACYNEQEIGRYLSASDLCVSPGNIGLTAIHSLSFGTPICTHNNLNNQMPEAQTITEGYNGFYFEENNVDDLENKIKNWFALNQERELVRKNCYEIIDKYYNPNYQLSVFNRLIENGKPEL